VIILIRIWCKWIHFLRRVQINNLHIFIPSDLDLWPLDVKFAPIVNLVQRCVSTKLEVSMAFLFRENRSTGRTDGRTDNRTGGKHNKSTSWAPSTENCLLIIFIWDKKLTSSAVDYVSLLVTYIYSHSPTLQGNCVGKADRQIELTVPEASRGGPCTCAVGDTTWDRFVCACESARETPGTDDHRPRGSPESCLWVV